MFLEFDITGNGWCCFMFYWQQLDDPKLCVCPSILSHSFLSSPLFVPLSTCEAGWHEPEHLYGPLVVGCSKGHRPKLLVYHEKPKWTLNKRKTSCFSDIVDRLFSFPISLVLISSDAIKMGWNMTVDGSLCLWCCHGNDLTWSLLWRRDVVMRRPSLFR